MTTIYAINANNMAVSDYENLTLKGMAYAGGKTIMLTTDKLMENTGDDDDGTNIAAYIQTGAMDFGDKERRKFCVEARTYGLFEKGATVTTRTNENGEQTDRAYKIPLTTGTLPRSRRVKLGKRPRAIAWSFKIANRNGGNIQINSFSIAPLMDKAAR